MVVQSMAVMGGLWPRFRARGSEVEWSVMSPGRRDGKDGSRPASSIKQQVAEGIRAACGPRVEVMK